jgi:WD40 repeat protein
VRLWDPVTGQIVRELRGFRGPPQSVTFNADGRFLTTTEYTRGEVNIWEVRSGEKLSTVPADLGPAEYGAAFSPDGNQFMVCGLHGVRIWNVVRAGPGEDGRMRLSLNAAIRQWWRSAPTAGCSPSLPIATNREVTIPVIRDPRPMRFVSFTPDGKRLSARRPDR